MYQNAGKSIKTLVTVIVAILMLLAITAGVGLASFLNNFGEGGSFIGFLVAVFGCFSAWLSGLILYAYGEIADGVKRLSSKFCLEDAEDRESGNSEESDRISFAKKLLDAQLVNGVISIEEYEEAMEQLSENNK